MIQAYLNNKIRISENGAIAENEDFKTSSVIGLLQYLPDEIFWDIFKKCSEHLEINPKINSFDFWPKFNPEKTENSDYVEPDVLIEADGIDVIIEVKKEDGGGQKSEQWKNEIQAVLNKQRDKNEKKRIILIALGDNNTEDKQPQIKVGKESFNVYRVSWQGLVDAVCDKYDELLNNCGDGNVCRIINEVQQLFRKLGMERTVWLESLYSDLKINTSVLKGWNVKKWK